MSEKFNKNAKLMLITIAALMMIGLMMVYSSSYIYARDTMGSSWYLIGKQASFLGLGMFSLLILSQVPFNFWYKYAYHFQWAGSLLLILSLTSFAGVNIKGSHRWISIAGFTLQPGELVKYTMLLSSIRFFEEYQTYNRDRLIINLATLFFPLLVLIIQPDFGTFVICCTVLFFSAFLSPFPRKILAGVFVTGLAMIFALLLAAPYRVKRLLTFLDPWADPKDSGFQIIQSYLAFANGGVTGTGLGASLQKLFYLPEAYNDFILSVLGEELGFIGIALVAILFIMFILFGFRMAMNINEYRGRVFASTVVFLIGFQALLNMGVVLGLLPTKGLNLPFISYGGSSLLANLSAIGIILSFNESDYFGLKKRLA